MQQTTISNFASFSKITNQAWNFMRIVCWQRIFMKYHTLFLSKTWKDITKFDVNSDLRVNHSFQNLLGISWTSKHVSFEIKLIRKPWKNRTKKRLTSNSPFLGSSDKLYSEIQKTLLQYYPLTLKAPITTAADDKFCDIFPNFRQK